MHRITEEQNYRDLAEKTLAYFASDYERYSFTAADYARVVDEFLNEPMHIKIVGAASTASAGELLAAALNEYAPAKLVQLLDPQRDAARLRILGYPTEGAAQAYICVGTMCLPPVGDAEKMREAFEKLQNHAGIGRAKIPPTPLNKEG